MKCKFLSKIISIVTLTGILLTSTLIPIRAANDANVDDIFSESIDNSSQSLYSGGNSFANAVTLTLNSTYNVSIDTAYEKEYFKFIPSATGFYTFESFSNSNADPYTALYNSFYNEIEYHDDGEDMPNFSLTYHLLEYETYYFTAESYSDTTGTYSVRIVNTPSADNLSTATVYIGSQTNVRITIPYFARYFEFTPPVSGEYYFVSLNSTDDPQAWIYDSSLTLINNNDDGPIALDFELTAYLQENRSYYIVVNNYSSGTGNFTLKTYRHLSYVNYYDQSFQNDSQLLSNIPLANNFSDYIYQKYFGIMLHMEGNATRHYTPLDDCSIYLHEPCFTEACGNKCILHHKNIGKIIRSLFNEPRFDDHLYILWTDREAGTYCNGQGAHVSTTYLGCIDIYMPQIIMMMRIVGEDANDKLACMGIVLAHETAHSLGISDVYDNVGHDQNGTVCVMERYDRNTATEFYQNVYDRGTSPFCQSCMQTMMQLTTNVVIDGNQ